MKYYCIDKIKGFTIGKSYERASQLNKQAQASGWENFHSSNGTASWDKFQIQETDGGYEGFEEHSTRVAGINALVKKRKKISDKRKKKGKKPLIDMIDDRGIVRSIREGQLTNKFTKNKEDILMLLRDAKLKKLTKQRY